MPNVWGSRAAVDAGPGAPPSIGPSEPWKQWPNEEKAIFLEEVLPTLRKHQLQTDEQLSTFLD